MTGNVRAVTETALKWMEVIVIDITCLLWLFGRGEMEREYKRAMKKLLDNSGKKVSEEQ